MLTKRGWDSIQVEESRVAAGIDAQRIVVVVVVGSRCGEAGRRQKDEEIFDVWKVDGRRCTRKLEGWEGEIARWNCGRGK
jgi:hypothetical protein